MRRPLRVFAWANPGYHFRLNILDHIGFNVADFAKSKAFYAQALAPLGIVILMEDPGWVMMSKDDRPQFWFGQFGPPTQRRCSRALPSARGRIHLAFAAANRAEVHAFYQAALAAGGQDNGAPGARPQYHPNYYGAFVIDFTRRRRSRTSPTARGHNIEAVCHRAEP